MPSRAEPWNKGRLIGPKPPLTADQVQLLRLTLRQRGTLRDQLLFALAIDTMLRGSDIVALQVNDVIDGQGRSKDTLTITQRKTDRRVSAWLCEETRALLSRYLESEQRQPPQSIFAGKHGRGTFSVVTFRQRVKAWFEWAGMDPMAYGTHSFRRSKTTMIYRKTGNLRACQKLLGHSSIQHTALYLGIEETEALEIAQGVVL